MACRSLDLRIAVAAGGLSDTILALHDPATRTIRMSIFSSSGTLAHELAHDLDWQAARSLYAGSGYSTDRAVREQRGPLATSMRDLAAARVVRRGAPPTEERPAEVFARSVDWLVAVSLAREGRSDGYLSAVQDAALTGYTTVSPVAMIFGAARPLVDAVEEMTYLPGVGPRWISLAVGRCPLGRSVPAGAAHFVGAAAAPPDRTQSVALRRRPAEPDE